MNEYIINSPQLQSPHKRFGALLTWLACWLMWAYLLTPLITLSAWLLGDNSLSDEIRWLGGYKSLLELLRLYVDTLFGLILLWLLWVFYHNWRRRPLIPAAKKIITDNDLCRYYQVDAEQLNHSRQANFVTVYFDEQGDIVDLQTGARGSSS